ncbi:hypothetical protein BC827DRAFT_1197716 [Russula dissimulans]|nr:hypothetical protein BC827DRAFT_1197716 [Russula dissimulans]
MVNFHDPNVLLSDLVALIKFSHAVNGLYIWEFFSNLDYEWSIIRGRRPYRWTMWIYVITRLATLITVILNLVDLNVAIPAGCQERTSLGYIFAYMTFSLSSLLIVLRIIAIWDKNKRIVVLATGIWLTNTSILIHGITQIRSRWDPELDACGLPNVMSNKSATISVLASDIVLLLIMFIGLFRVRRRSGGTFGLARLLWKQGVIYLLVATAAEVPPLVFIYLDLNVAFNLMFSMPSLIAMSIGATRMYRSLVEVFYNDNSGKGPDNLPGQRVGQGTPKVIRTTTTTTTMTTTTTPSPPNQMEVFVHTSYEHWQPPATQTGPCLSFINIERQMGEKSRDMSLDDDVESGAERNDFLTRTSPDHDLCVLEHFVP